MRGRIGSLNVNILRLVLAFLLLLPLCAVLRGRPFPSDASPRAWVLLGLSGLFGFTFGDFCLFRSYVILGPRLSNVMMALAPPLTALIGWLLLGETLSGRALLPQVRPQVGLFGRRVDLLFVHLFSSLTPRLPQARG